MATRCAEDGDQDGEAQRTTGLLAGIEQSGRRGRFVLATPKTAVRGRVTKFSPMPKPNRTMGPNTPLTYELSGEMSVCQKRPIPVSADPVIMNGLGPRTGGSRCDSPAP
jgi:hypothetical protein